jgi:hypothetical protein
LAWPGNSRFGHSERWPALHDSWTSG